MSASTRGNTRNSIGEMPIVLSASISCVTFIVPSCAANAAPVRPGHDDRGHHRAHVARHADADQVGDEDGRAELLELHGSHEGEDGADQETDERDDPESIGAAILDRDHQIDAPIARAAGDEPAKRNRHRSEERDEAADRLGVGDGRGAYALDSGAPAAAECASVFSGTVSASSTSRLSPLGRPAGSTVRPRAWQSSRTSVTKATRLLSHSPNPAESNAIRRGIGDSRQLVFHRRARGKSPLKAPIAGQREHQGLIRGAAEGKL